MAKSAFDPKLQQLKRKKQAIVLFILLAAVLAFSVPRTLKILRGSSPASATTTTLPSTRSPATGTTSPSGSAAAATQQAVSATSADSFVVNADLQPAPLEGQMANLTTFRTKDPFVQQENTGAVGEASTPATSATAASAASAAKPSTATTKPTTAPTTAPTLAPPSSTGVTPPPAPAPAPTSAVLSVNGVQEAVNAGSDFPASEPLFHLVSLTTKSAKISIAGGSLASGAPTVTIQLGKPTTLMNTADGTRYVLLLVSVGGAVATTATSSTATQTP